MQEPLMPPNMSEKAASHQDYIMRGVAYALMAYAMFAVMQTAAKMLSTTHSVFEIAFYRNLIGIVPLGIYLLRNGGPRSFIPRKPLWMLYRVINGSIGLVLTFSAVKYLPLADATVLFFTGVLLTPALAFFFLKENIGPHRWAAIAFGLIGVLIMVRPSGQYAALGILLGLLAAFAQATTNIILRHLREESPLAVTFYFMLGGFVLSSFFMPYVALKPTLIDCAWFLAVGVSGGLGQFFITSALRNAPASIVAPLNYSGLLWASLFDIAVWHVVPGWGVYTGGLLILLSNLYIIYRERLQARLNKNQAVTISYD